MTEVAQEHRLNPSPNFWAHDYSVSTDQLKFL